MEKSKKIKLAALSNDENQMLDLLNGGLDPNHEGGWPIRLAARNGSLEVVKVLLQYGANPHLLGEAGASTLQLAVFSGMHWESGAWAFLLSCCDSSQLADGAAVAVIFKNIFALKRILETGRCNTNIPTTLTGKTIEQLAKGYKMHYLLNTTLTVEIVNNITPVCSPRTRNSGESRMSQVSGNTLTPPNTSQRNLSPSVARFFQQTSAQASLTPSGNNIISSPTSWTNC